MINSSMLCFLYSPTLTSVHDYWKNLDAVTYISMFFLLSSELRQVEKGIQKKFRNMLSFRGGEFQFLTRFYLYVCSFKHSLRLQSMLYTHSWAWGTSDTQASFLPDQCLWFTSDRRSSDCSLFQEPPLQSPSVHLVCTGLGEITGALAFFSTLHYFLPSLPHARGILSLQPPCLLLSLPKATFVSFPFLSLSPLGLRYSTFIMLKTRKGQDTISCVFPLRGFLSCSLTVCLKALTLFFFNYIFIYFWLCWVFVAVWAFV